MKQQTILTEQPKLTVPKPSEILKQAHFEGVKQCRNSFRRGDSYCARGIIIKFYGNSKGFKINDIYTTNMSFTNGENIVNIEHEYYAKAMFGKHSSELTYNELSKINNIQHDLASYNDGSSRPNFLQCAEFLERQGL